MSPQASDQARKMSSRNGRSGIQGSRRRCRPGPGSTAASRAIATAVANMSSSPPRRRASATAPMTDATLTRPAVHRHPDGIQEAGLDGEQQEEQRAGAEGALVEHGRRARRRTGRRAAGAPRRRRRRGRPMIALSPSGVQSGGDRADHHDEDRQRRGEAGGEDERVPPAARPSRRSAASARRRHSHASRGVRGRRSAQVRRAGGHAGLLHQDPRERRWRGADHPALERRRRPRRPWPPPPGVSIRRRCAGAQRAGGLRLELLAVERGCARGRPASPPSAPGGAWRRRSVMSE